MKYSDLVNFFNSYLVKKCYEGRIDLEKINKDFYAFFEYNFEKLNKPIFSEIKKGDFTQLFSKKSESIGRFSAAKTWQQAKELTSSVFENGSKVPFDIFEEKAKNIVEKYNRAYLLAEYNAVSANTFSARTIIETKQLGAEYLQYSAIGDGHTRPDHLALNGITLPASHPFWKTHAPPNGWNCRCEVIAVSKFEEEFRKTSDKEVAKKSRLINKEFEKDPSFAYNPATTDWVFKPTGAGKHDYYKMPATYKKQLVKNNFGFK